MTSPIDNTLLELFRTEVELHSETLTAGMLALEQAPADESTLERLMRASHSIKGAARIVQMTPAAEISHALEDCFVAAQRKTLQLAPAHIDALLKGVDLLAQCSTATRSPNWDPAPFAPLATDYTARLKQLLHSPPPEVAPSGAVAVTSSTPVGHVAHAPPVATSATASHTPPNLSTLPPSPATGWAAAPSGSNSLSPLVPEFAATNPGEATAAAGGLASQGSAPLAAPRLPTAIPIPVTSAPGASEGLSNATVICPSRLDRQSAELTRRQVLATLAFGPAVITLDCSATEDFDAAGLAFLVAAERHCAELSRTLRLAPVSATLQELLPLVGLGHLVGEPR
jgi:chemotaxis protein histidine kinase CheA